SRPALTHLPRRRSVARPLAARVGAVVATAALDRIGLARRATGSRAAAAFSSNAFPLTIWAFDAVPTIDLERWRIRVDGNVASPGTMDYDGLLALPSTERDAVLDCTGGWWTEQRWRGVTLADVLERHGVRASAQRIDVVSLTGHAWSFPIAEAERLLIATHVGGETLSAGHGYPGRRGAGEWHPHPEAGDADRGAPRRDPGRSLDDGSGAGRARNAHHVPDRNELGRRAGSRREHGYRAAHQGTVGLARIRRRHHPDD